MIALWVIAVVGTATAAKLGQTQPDTPSTSQTTPTGDKKETGPKTYQATLNFEYTPNFKISPTTGHDPRNPFIFPVDRGTDLHSRQSSHSHSRQGSYSKSRQGSYSNSRQGSYSDHGTERLRLKEQPSASNHSRMNLLYSRRNSSQSGYGGSYTSPHYDRHTSLYSSPSYRYVSMPLNNMRRRTSTTGWISPNDPTGPEELQFEDVPYEGGQYSLLDNLGTDSMDGSMRNNLQTDVGNAKRAKLAMLFPKLVNAYDCIRRSQPHKSDRYFEKRVKHMLNKAASHVVKQLKELFKDARRCVKSHGKHGNSDALDSDLQCIVKVAGYVEEKKHVEALLRLIDCNVVVVDDGDVRCDAMGYSQRFKLLCENPSARISDYGSGAYYQVGSAMDSQRFYGNENEE